MYRPDIALVAALVVAMVGGAIGWQAQGWRLGRVIAEDREAHAHALALAVEEARAEEQRRAKQMEEVAHAARSSLKRADADRVRAAATADRLREHVARLAGQCSSDPAPAAGGEAPRAAGPVLADMLGGMDEAARALARYADELAVSARACEAAYNSLTKGRE